MWQKQGNHWLSIYWQSAAFVAGIRGVVSLTNPMYFDSSPNSSIVSNTHIASISAVLCWFMRTL